MFEPESVYKHFKKKIVKYCEGSTFNVTDENQKVIEYLMLYICNLPEFEELPVDGTLISKPRLNAGICLIGNPGSGKSIIMKTLADLAVPGNIIQCLDCDVLAEDYELRGADSFIRFNSPFDNVTKGLTKPAYLFDDLGSEAKKKHFGNYTDVMASIIAKQYRHYVDHGVKSHFTANLTRKDILDVYGMRTESRLWQMCNFIILGQQGSKDWRKIF